MKIWYEPLLYRILIKVDDIAEETMTKGGLHLLPPSAQKKERESMLNDKGVVLAIGDTAYDGFREGARQVKVGDKVLFRKNAGTMIEDPNTGVILYRVVNDEDIACVILEE